jgi:hypothetical protein
MNKIIITAVLFVFSTMSANAIDRDSFSVFSLTGGVAANTSVWGATAKNDEFDDTDTTITQTDKEHGVFAETFSSQFIELGIGKYISLGFEHTPDSISTPQNVSNHENANGSEQKTSVDFNDVNTTYVKLNIPGGAYVKYGTVETDMDVKTTRSSYNDVSISGTSTGAGYEKFIGESGFGVRIEANYIEFDNATSQDVATALPGGNGKTVIKASNLEGASAKVALTYTLGRNK